MDARSLCPEPASGNRSSQDEKIKGQLNPLRFLHISSVFPPAFAYGGVPQAAFGLAAGLKQQGHENLVLTTDADGRGRLLVPSECLTEFKGLEVIYARRWRQNPYFYSPSLSRHIKQRAANFDIALVRGNWGYINWTVRSNLTEMGIPYLLYPEGTFDPWAIKRRRLRKMVYWRLIEKINYAHASGVVALCREEYNQVKIFVKSAQVEIIPNGIDLDIYHPNMDGNFSNMEFPGLGRRKFILFLSRLHVKKGLDILIPAFGKFLNYLTNTDDSPVLVVAGTGADSYVQKLKEIAGAAGVGSQIFFAGLVSGIDKLSLLQNCSFMVLPSRSEGLPMAPLEGMACGKAVIVTRNCNLPEIEEAEAGLLVDFSQEAMAQAMRKLWLNENQRRIMGERAVNLIKAKFTWPRVAEQTVAFCRRIIDEHRG
jgi:glycosyltransferase involved in cell wall biosynthesis